MRTNLIVLLADLLNLFEIHPAKCVSCPGLDPGVSGKPVRKPGRGAANMTMFLFTIIPIIFILGYTRDRWGVLYLFLS